MKARTWGGKYVLKAFGTKPNSVLIRIRVDWRKIGARGRLVRNRPAIRFRRQSAPPPRGGSSARRWRHCRSSRARPRRSGRRGLIRRRARCNPLPNSGWPRGATTPRARPSRSSWSTNACWPSPRPTTFDSRATRTFGRPAGEAHALAGDLADTIEFVRRGSAPRRAGSPQPSRRPPDRPGSTTDRSTRQNRPRAARG